MPWNLRVHDRARRRGDPFAASLDGPAYEALKVAIEEAYGRELTTEGQGGSIPLCNVLAETFPDAEIILMGVEEPNCLIHAPERERRPVGDRAHGARRGAVPRALCGSPAMSVQFTVDDYRGRIAHAAQQAADIGLSGVLITPGPDLVYLTGYMPTAITERLTMLVAHPDREPAMLVPILERPDAEAATGAPALELSDWTDGSDPYAAAAKLLDPGGRYAVSDSTWAMHVLGLQETLPQSGYVSMTAKLPMLRAVKDGHEFERLAAAGEAADASFYEIIKVRFAGRRETDVAADLANLLIEPGMCFSIEPGIYLSGRFGVRIEDIVTATADGGRRFNHTTREMQIVA